MILVDCSVDMGSKGDLTLFFVTNFWMRELIHEGDSEETLMKILEVVTILAHLPMLLSITCVHLGVFDLLPLVPLLWF